MKGLTRIYFGNFGDAALPGGKQCRLIVTGQTREYRPGDDGTYQAGAAFSYHTEIISGDLVTVDHNTGLMWASDGIQEGCCFGQQTDWYSAIDYCNNLVFAGHEDWRLPNRRELGSLLKKLSYYAIDEKYFPNTRQMWYEHWSSTTYEGDTSSAWFANFIYGYIDKEDKTCGFAIRAVRGGL